MYEPIIRLEEFRIMNARAYLYAQRCKTFCAKLHSSENEWKSECAFWYEYDVNK